MSYLTYATREQVVAASDVKASAYYFDTVDRLLRVASRTIEAKLHRKFYPTIATRLQEWPDRGSFWLKDDLLSVSSLTIDGATVTGYVLEDRFYGAPYSRIDFDDANIASGDEVTIEGVWGYCNDTESCGTLASAISSTSATTAVVSDASLVGVGDQLLIDSERMVVTDRTYSTTGTTLGSDVAANAATVTIPVADGTAVKEGETILIDSEYMKVLSVVGNNLTVKRAVDGSVLATHSSGATASAARTLTVVRADAGTTAATHSLSAAISKNVPPALIRELCIAEAQYLMGQEQAAWNLTIGEGEGQRESSGKSIAGIRREAVMLYGRGRYGRAI